MTAKYLNFHLDTGLKYTFQRLIKKFFIDDSPIAMYATLRGDNFR
jgi:hypothetical protein